MSLQNVMRVVNNKNTTIILVHGYLGYPENCFFPWLQSRLESKGHDVIIPAMPNPAFPEKETWVKTIRQVVTDPKKTILVGHSLGCVAILQYLMEYRGSQFPQVILTAGFGRDFLSLGKISDWFDEKLDFTVLKKKALKWTCVHSTNDLLVPFREGEWLASQLGAKLIIEKKGHLTKREGAAQLPSLLKAIVT
jgi:predicted alpha/beta hydrolase family esterase